MADEVLGKRTRDGDDDKPENVLNDAQIGDDSHDDVGPMPKGELKKKRKVVHYDDLYLEHLPNTDNNFTRHLEAPSFATVLRMFYGMYIPREFVRIPEDHRPSTVSYDTAKEYLKTCLRTVSCSSPAVEEAVIHDGSAYHQLIAYFQHLAWYATALDATTLPPHGPAMGWSDLNQFHASYVLSNLKERLVIQRIEWCIRKEVHYQVYWPNTLIRVLFYRATDVLWLLRRIADTETSVEAALKELVTLGIQFTFATTAFTHSITPALPASASEAIPWRCSPFTATTVDYQEYLARRTQLFSSTSVLRAALLSGGIIWRIAMEHTSDPVSLLTTTADEIRRIGSRARLPNRDVLAELSLTEEQKQIIIGVYRVSSTSPPPTNCRTVSWFPSQTSFAKSGVNMGFWSNDAESWYQLRVHNYLHGLKQPVATHKVWASTLTLYQHANRVARGYEDRARRVLDAALGFEW